MRLMTFSGTSLTEVMAQVRRDLGPDAVIISTGNRPGGGIEVRAAAEGPRFGDLKEAPRLRASRESEAQRRVRPDREADDHLSQILAFHCVPARAAEALVKAARQFEDRGGTAALAAALDARFRFRPCPPVAERPLLISGPPGAGKTSVLAKLAARAVAEGAQPVLISADCERAGAEARLNELAGKLKLQFLSCDDPRELSKLAEAHDGQPLLIDAPACNPFDIDDLDMLHAFASPADAEILAVIDGGQSADDAGDAAAMFAAIGANRVVMTKLDSARRLGAVIAAGEAGLAFAQISASPYIGTGLAPATSLRLARTLLDERDLPQNASEGDV